MSFQAKTDYFNFAGSGIALIASTQNKTAQTVDAKNEKGDIVEREIVGEMEAPNCTYALSGDTSLSNMSLGLPTSGGYIITSIKIDTAAGTPPSITVAGESEPISGDSHADCYYDVPACSIEVCHHAQNILSGFSFSGTGVYLIGCNTTIECGLTKATKDSATIAYDVTDGKLIQEATFQQTGSATPTVTTTTGWEVTSPLTKTDPDSSFPTWTCTVEKPLTHHGT